MERRASSTLTDSTCPRAPRARAAGCRRCRRCGTGAGARSARVSTASRVVPGISLTIIRSSRSNRLTSDDLPAFGRPTIATDDLGRTGPVIVAAAARRAVVVARLPARRPVARRAGTRCDDRVEQVADALAVLGRDLEHRVEAELIELERAGLGPLVVGLVDGEDDRPVRPARTTLAISRSPGTSPSRPSTTRTRRSAVRDRALPAFEHELVQRILAGAEHAAGVDELEARALPLRRLGNHVARGARDRRHDGAARAR